jgi:hypothetical protein
MKTILCALLVISILFIACTSSRNYSGSDPLAPGGSSDNWSREGVRSILNGRNAYPIRGSRQDPTSIQVESTIRDNNPSESKKITDTSEIQRIMIYDGSVFLESKKEPDSIISRIKTIALDKKGYVLNVGKSDITIRVPAESMNETLSEIYLLGTVSNKWIYGRDVTDSYYDLIIQLDNLEKIRQRYLELLQKSESVEITLKIEKELERLQLQIESLKGQFQRLSHLKDYSTIVVNIIAPSSPGPIGWIFVGLYEGIKWLFVWN